MFFLILAASAAATNCQTNAAVDKTPSCKYLSFAEAETILGRRVEIITNSWFVTAEITRIECVYRAVEGNREASLFLLIEETADAAEAQESYEMFRAANKNQKGVEVLSGIGDRAYRHGDPPNFYFLMAQQGRFTIRLKINKAVESVSPEEIKTAARRIAEQLKN